MEAQPKQAKEPGVMPEEPTAGMSLHEATPASSLRRRSLKIEAIGDFAGGKIKPRIRLTGQWLEQAGFKPGHRVEISYSKAGELVLQFQETPLERAKDSRGPGQRC